MNYSNGLQRAILVVVREAMHAVATQENATGTHPDCSITEKHSDAVYGGYHAQWVDMTLTIPSEGRAITMRVEVPDTIKAEDYFAGTGHTDFQAKGSTYSFDRHGIDDSFYLKHEDSVSTLVEEMHDQIKRARESQDRLARAIPLGIGHYERTPEEIAAMVADLKAGKRVSLLPGGFGTGYVLSLNAPPRRRSRSYGGPTAHAALAKALGLPKVYVESIDCD